MSFLRGPMTRSEIQRARELAAVGAPLNGSPTHAMPLAAPPAEVAP